MTLLFPRQLQVKLLAPGILDVTVVLTKDVVASLRQRQISKMSAQELLSAVFLFPPNYS